MFNTVMQIILFVLGVWFTYLFFETLVQIVRRHNRRAEPRIYSNHPVIEVFTQPDGKRAAAFQEGGLITLRETDAKGKRGKQILRGSFADVRRKGREWMKSL